MTNAKVRKCENAEIEESLQSSLFKLRLTRPAGFVEI